MIKLTQELIDKIAQSCIDLYLGLPKSGKPTDQEWTVLSCVVKLILNQDDDNVEVVSLGTGSKCIGASKMCPMGQILNDSHAEVCARRGFILYLYHQIRRTLMNQTSIFILKNEKMVLKDHVCFLFFSSQLPCGDASIILKEIDEEQCGNLVLPLKRRLSQEKESISYIEQQTMNDVHRTGAKCLPNDNQDPRLPGLDYHVLGQVRTKPGRGDRTLSVSCSDKIAKWIHLGIQGSLLSMLIHEPIRIYYFIFGFGTPFSAATLQRAIVNRNNYNPGIIDTLPVFFRSTVRFPDLKSQSKSRAAPGSIVWCQLDTPINEVAVTGKKLGATKRDGTAMKNILSISKYSLFKEFINIISKNEYWKDQIAGKQPLDTLRYNEVKEKALVYKEKWILLKRDFFKTWTSKPNMWDFCIK